MPMHSSKCGADADGLLTGVEGEDITLIYMITKKGEVIQTLDIQLGNTQMLGWMSRQRHNAGISNLSHNRVSVV